MDIGSVLRVDKLNKTNSSKTETVSLKSTDSAVQKNPALERKASMAYAQQTTAQDKFEKLSKSIVSQASLSNADLVDESERLQDLREQAELKRSELQEQKEAANLEKAKEIIANLGQKKLSLRFELSDDFENERVVRVIDRKSDEVIRQIPSDEFLRLAQAIDNYHERMAHDDMVADPTLKSKGVDTSNVNENLRGVVINDII